MRKAIPIFIIVLALAGFFLWQKLPIGKPHSVTAINSYQDCIAAGYTLTTSYPPRCQTADGRYFSLTQEAEASVQQKISVNQPQPYDTVTTPLLVRGEAFGPWYYEGAFPVKLTDSGGTVLGTGVAKAKADWATVELVPFQAVVEYHMPATASGILVLSRANPTNQSALNEALTIPINFSLEASPTAQISSLK